MIQIVYLEWQDSAGADSVWSEDADIKPAMIMSAGLLVKEDSDAVVLATSIDDNDPPKYDGLLAIPQTAITRRHNLGMI